MKIEAGKYYETRRGEKAFVAGISPFTSTDPLYHIVGWIDGTTDAAAWGLGGAYADRAEAPEDLVAEWTEPPTPLEALKVLHRLANQPKPDPTEWNKAMRDAVAAIAAAK